jgi:inner membrane protein
VASILSHPAVPLAVGLALGSRWIPGRLLTAGVIASIVPDADVIAFRLDVSYDHALAHRGITHSIAFACLCGALAAAAWRWLGARPWVITAFVAVSMASHGMLDALTDGGQGIMFWWPFDEARHFWPVTPIEVSPIGIRGFFSARGIEVLWSELKWVWVPAVILGAAFHSIRVFITKSAGKLSL